MFYNTALIQSEGFSFVGFLANGSKKLFIKIISLTGISRYWQ